MRYVGDDAGSIAFGHVDHRVAHCFLLVTGISAASWTARHVDDAKCLVLVKIVRPATVQCLPVIVSKEPRWISATTTVRFH